MKKHIKRDIMDKLEVRCNLKILQQYLRDKYDFEINLSNLRNLEQKSKSDKDNLTLLVKQLQEKHGKPINY